jgi:hypothetical protein
MIVFGYSSLKAGMELMIFNLEPVILQGSKTACFGLRRVGITGMHHHAWLLRILGLLEKIAAVTSPVFSFNCHFFNVLYLVL